MPAEGGEAAAAAAAGAERERQIRDAADRLAAEQNRIRVLEEELQAARLAGNPPPMDLIKPIMGGLKQQEQIFVAWTGGKPKRGWTELEAPNPGAIQPTQYRPRSIGSQNKSQYYRVKGQTTLFTRETDLLTFQKKLMKHFVKFGMDTITYLNDPNSVDEIVCVVTNHARFTFEEAKNAEAEQAPKYDSYDLANILDAVEWLDNSIDEDLDKQLYENCPEGATFIIRWMHLIKIVGTTSIDRFDKIKDRIKGRLLANYPGENVDQICSDYNTDWRELHGAQMYDNNLTLMMVQIIMHGGNEDFRFDMRSLRSNLEKVLLKIRHFDYVQAYQYLVEKELDVSSALAYSKEMYRKQIDNKQWPAAQHATDSKAISRSYGTANKTTLRTGSRSDNLAHASALQRNDSQNRRGACNNCGSLEHWWRDCPQRDQGQAGAAPVQNRPNPNQVGPNNNRGPPPRRNNNQAPRQAPRNNNNRGNPTRNGSTRPPMPPPRQGESETKTLPSGKTLHWCSHGCGWNRTHNSSGHLTKEQLSANRNVNGRQNPPPPPPRPANRVARMARYDVQPSAFMVQAPNRPRVNTDRASPQVNMLQFGFNQSPFQKHIHQESWILPLLSIAVIIVSACDQRSAQAILQMCIPLGLGHWLIYHMLFNSHDRLKALNDNQARLEHLISRMERDKTRNFAAFRRLKAQVDVLQAEIARLKRQQGGSSDMRMDHRASHPRPNPNGSRHARATPNNAPNRRANNANMATIFGTKSGCCKILFDSGANCCISNNADDFQGTLDLYEDSSHVEGISSQGLLIEGDGLVYWDFEADDGTTRTLVLPCYYVPSTNACIASTDVVLEQYPSEEFRIKQDSLTLSGDDVEPPITVPICTDTRLPFGPLVFKGERKKKAPKTVPSAPSLIESANYNLSEPMKEMLRWHYKCGHISMSQIQLMFRQGILATTEQARRLQIAASKLISGLKCTLLRQTSFSQENLCRRIISIVIQKDGFSILSERNAWTTNTLVVVSSLTTHLDSYMRPSKQCCIRQRRCDPSSILNKWQAHSALQFKSTLQTMEPHSGTRSSPSI